MKEETNTTISTNISHETLSETTISGENVYYKSEQLVPLLGLDADQIRYRAKEYDEFLHTHKTGGGHLRFTDHDVEMLRTIQHLMDAGYSKAEIKAMLRDPGTHLVIAGKDAKDTAEIKALLANNEFLINHLTAVFDKALTEAVAKVLSEQATCIENTRLIEKKIREDEINQLNQALDKLYRQNDLITVQLQQTTEELRLLKEEKNKKGFFSRFRK